MPERTKEASHLTDWLNVRDIRAVFFDLDGTLLDTHANFKDAKDKYVNYIVNRIPKLDHGHLIENLHKLDREAMIFYAVSPNRWPLVVSTLAEIYDEDKKVFLEGLPILMQIYKTAPEPFPGALETLATFHAANQNLGVLTNAGQEWTNIKLRMNGISGFFKHKMIVKDTTFKRKEHWAEGVSTFNVKPEQVLAIGDDETRDIIAAHEAGIKYKIWVLGTWSDRNVEVPEDTIKVEGGIGKVIETLLR